MGKRYIIGDVHGCIKTLKALINRLPKDAKITFVGDLVDRGEDSKAVIEFVRNNNYDCVMGNHEVLFIENYKLLKQSTRLLNLNNWYNLNGGYETLKSYHKIFSNFMESSQLKQDIEWLEKLPSYLEYPNIKNDEGRYLVVSHSSVGNKWQYKDYDFNSQEFKKFEKQVIWSRDKKIYDNKNIFNIFGHTPVENIEISNYYANIDKGCVYTDGDMLGYLVAIEFPSLKIIKQKNID